MVQVRSSNSTIMSPFLRTQPLLMIFSILAWYALSTVSPNGDIVKPVVMLLKTRMGCRTLTTSHWIIPYLEPSNQPRFDQKVPFKGPFQLKDQRGHSGSCGLKDDGFNRSDMLMIDVLAASSHYI